MSFAPPALLEEERSKQERVRYLIHWLRWHRSRSCSFLFGCFCFAAFPSRDIGIELLLKHGSPVHVPFSPVSQEMFALIKLCSLYRTRRLHYTTPLRAREVHNALRENQHLLLFYTMTKLVLLLPEQLQVITVLVATLLKYSHLVDGVCEIKIDLLYTFSWTSWFNCACYTQGKKSFYVQS